jgi:hypothetical protein
MGKGQKARLAAANKPPSVPVPTAKSTSIFVPGKGLVSAPVPVRPTPAGGRSSSSGGLSIGAKAGPPRTPSPGALGLPTRTPSPGNLPTAALLTIDNSAILAYLALPSPMRIASLESHLYLNFNDATATSSSSVTDCMDSLSLSDSMAALTDLSAAPASSSSGELSLVPLALNPSELASISFRRGLFSPDGSRILASMVAQVGAGRESGLVLLSKMLDSHERALEPFVLPLMSQLLALQADKSMNIRDQAFGIAEKCVERLCPYAARTVFPALIGSLDVANDWRVKVAALTLMNNIASRESGQLSLLLPQIIPVVSECMKDPKKQVRDIGEQAMQALCSSISNEDIVHLVPQLVSVISHPEESAATLDQLMETTFVATVDAATLALITPLLIKSLKERSSPMKRKAARVIDNMCRLVQNPADVAPFMPFLLPALDKVSACLPAVMLHCAVLIEYISHIVC